MRVLCPAKINLHLRVGQRREADGFHPLLTWMTTVSLFDTLTVEHLSTSPTPAGTCEGQEEPVAIESPPHRERAGAARILSLSSDLPGLPVDESNLIVRAAQAFAGAIAGSGAGDVDQRVSAGRSRDAEHGGYAALDSSPFPQAASDEQAAQQSLRGPADFSRVSGVSQRDDASGIVRRQAARVGGEVARVGPVGAVLEKKIPLGAGLGGGSSDAARTLIALNRLWGIDWPVDRLSAVAAQLGSDVPFFLHGPSSVCRGRGEVVQPVAPPRVARWAVLVLPNLHMPTAAVYRRFDEMRLGFDAEVNDETFAWEQWAGLPAKDLLGRLVNDLEPPAFDLRPDLAELRRGIESSLARPVRMSGSGSSLFTLYDDDDEQEARAQARSTEAQFSVRARAVEVGPSFTDDASTSAPSPA